MQAADLHGLKTSIPLPLSRKSVVLVLLCTGLLGISDLLIGLTSCYDAVAFTSPVPSIWKYKLARVGSELAILWIANGVLGIVAGFHFRWYLQRTVQGATDIVFPEATRSVRLPTLSFSFSDSRRPSKQDIEIESRFLVPVEDAATATTAATGALAGDSEPSSRRRSSPEEDIYYIKMEDQGSASPISEENWSTQDTGSLTRAGTAEWVPSAASETGTYRPPRHIPSVTYTAVLGDCSSDPAGPQQQNGTPPQSTARVTYIQGVLMAVAQGLLKYAYTAPLAYWGAISTLCHSEGIVGSLLFSTALASFYSSYGRMFSLAAAVGLVSIAVAGVKTAALPFVSALGVGLTMASVGVSIRLFLPPSDSFSPSGPYYKRYAVQAALGLAVATLLACWPFARSYLRDDLVLGKSTGITSLRVAATLLCTASACQALGIWSLNVALCASHAEALVALFPVCSAVVVAVVWSTRGVTPDAWCWIGILVVWAACVAAVILRHKNMEVTTLHVPLLQNATTPRGPPRALTAAAVCPGQNEDVVVVKPLSALPLPFLLVEPVVT